MAGKKRRKKARRAKPPPRLRGRKAWALRISLALAAPILFLLLVEAALWVVGFGRPTDFLIQWNSGDDGLLVTNRDFCRQFVPKQLSREPRRRVLAANKDKSTVRIFVLGGSAANGDPDPAYGFGRMLEVLLNESSSEHTFEVVNAAVTAMDSSVARRVARDCARYDPDVFIAYMGNNEVVGPGGPAALPPWLHGSRLLMHARLAAKGTRLGQLLTRLTEARGGVPKKWRGMQRFLEDQIPLGDPRLENCYRHLQSNLRDILRTARHAGAKVVLCTVPTNLRSCPPLGSQHRPGLGEEELRRWQESFDEGRNRQQAGRHEEALAKFRQANTIDDAYAELAFRMGQCAENLGATDEAKQHYRRARDLDTLRFRADSRMNTMIRGLAEARGDDPSLALVDLEKVLENHSADGLLGNDLLLDHVHLNFRANLLAATAAMEAVKQLLPEIKFNAPEAGSGIDLLEERLRQRFLYDARAEFEIATKMYRRKTHPPFVGQLDHDAEMAAARDAIFELRKTVKQVPRAELEATYSAAVEKFPEDPSLLSRWAAILVTLGKTEQAIARYRQRLDAAPYRPALRLGLAEVLARVGRSEDALATLTAAKQPYAMGREEALGIVGEALIKGGQKAQAEEVFKQLLDLDPANVDALVNLGAVLVTQDQPIAAEEYLRRALQYDPACFGAMLALGDSFVKRRNAEEACRWYRNAVEAEPYESTTQAGLGLQLARQHRPAEGLEHLERSVVLDPTFLMGYRLLAKIYRMQDNHRRAQQYEEMAVLFQSD